MSDINYLLIEANKLKIGGYNFITKNSYYAFAEAVYAGDPKGLKKITSFINSSVNWVRNNKGMEEGYPFLYANTPLMRRSRGLASSETSPFVSSVYKKALLLDTYRELAFTLFILRLVDPIDYIAHETDVGYVVGKFVVQANCGDGYLHLTPVGYTKLMLGYIYNASRDVDYGVCTWDFVYHINKTLKSFSMYDRGKLIDRELSNGYLLGDRNVLGLSDKIIEKYTEEVAIMCPVMSRIGFISKNEVGKVLLTLGKSKEKVKYIQFILNNQDLFNMVNTEGIKYSCSWSI